MQEYWVFLHNVKHITFSHLYDFQMNIYGRKWVFKIDRVYSSLISWSLCVSLTALQVQLAKLFWYFSNFMKVNGI